SGHRPGIPERAGDRRQRPLRVPRAVEASPDCPGPAAAEPGSFPFPPEHSGKRVRRGSGLQGSAESPAPDGKVLPPAPVDDAAPSTETLTLRRPAPAFACNLARRVGL